MFLILASDPPKACLMPRYLKYVRSQSDLAELPASNFSCQDEGNQHLEVPLSSLQEDTVVTIWPVVKGDK